jgi:1,4-alpha-glucan branching enzyme
VQELSSILLLPSEGERDETSPAVFASSFANGFAKIKATGCYGRYRQASRLTGRAVSRIDKTNVNAEACGEVLAAPGSPFTEYDLFLFNEGTHCRLHEKLGAHRIRVDAVEGTYFAVWAPNADLVLVVGDFNLWNKEKHPLRRRGSSGIWETFVPGVGPGATYKYHIIAPYLTHRVDKADPFAVYAEVPPKTASIVHDLAYEWGDRAWMEVRAWHNSRSSPISIYELHLGSWMRPEDERGRLLSYRELAPKLADYIVRMGFTHVEFLPVMEHPFYGSWGYQTTGYFAPTSRYGTPQDFMYLIDHLHQQEIGVILDWVPAHFPTDEHSLGFFDGTHLYEHADPRRGFHPHWKSSIFNYDYPEVRSFLLSSALFWLDVYHADGLRVDGVASMLYLDYGRKAGEWISNQYGRNENMGAIKFLRDFNAAVDNNHPDVLAIAEESTAWPMVSRPSSVGGLGFGMKWDMGWMHDTLSYLSKEPGERKRHHKELTFRLTYAFTEHFVLSLSHDEAVHGKGSLLGKMPGDDGQKFAHLRMLYGFMYAQPGKKLLFMGSEFGQRGEWDHDADLEWSLLRQPAHANLQKWVQDLNAFYRSEPELHELDSDPAGFEWIEGNDRAHSVLSFLRKGRSTQDVVLVVCNFSSTLQTSFRVGAPRGGFWKELLNSDASPYGGSGQGNWGGVEALAIPSHDRPHSLSLTVPPLSTLFFKSTAAMRHQEA